VETGGADAQTGYNDQVAASSHMACFFAVRCPAEGRRGVPLSAEQGEMVLHLSRVNDSMRRLAGATAGPGVHLGSPTTSRSTLAAALGHIASDGELGPCLSLVENRDSSLVGVLRLVAANRMLVAHGRALLASDGPWVTGHHLCRHEQAKNVPDVRVQTAQQSRRCCRRELLSELAGSAIALKAHLEWLASNLAVTIRGVCRLPMLATKKAMLLQRSQKNESASSS
jgi:hypothetical protein